MRKLSSDNQHRSPFTPTFSPMGRGDPSELGPMLSSETQAQQARLVTPAMLALWLVLATVPLWITKVGLYPYLGIEILIWSLYALAFNLVLGTAGLPSFGHGAYFGIGAYAFGLCQFNVVANLWVCLAASLAVAGLAGALVALFISHRRGIYYAFMTIAFGQIFWTLAIKSHSITGGEDGLLKIARLPANVGVASFDLTDNVALYYFVLIVFALAVSGMWRLVNSPYGRVIAAIRQSETRASHLGYHVWLYKASIFTLSAAVSGLAGGLFAMAQLAAFPDVMSLHQSGYVVMMTLVGGGLVSFWGPVVGVFIFLIARDVIGALTNAWMLYFGLLFIAIVLFRPEGIAGAVTAAFQKHSLNAIRRQGSSAMRLLFGGERWR
jgi:branched-chain amino acid transport system permease protein